MLVDVMKFTRNSLLIPNELQMEVENGVYFISSIVYAYFLMFLCHYHLNNFGQCLDCLHTLQLVIAEHYLIDKDSSFSLLYASYDILGIAFQLLRDSESARQAFMQSV
ncbi:Hypothetical predicted protein [Mytilus galloprovincialis]|nr:Hypothetical predicted protein [Mytilus galloprovincialis]